MRLSLSWAAVVAVGRPLLADDPRPTPATRPEMKKLIEEMKERKPRIPLPELTDADKEKLRNFVEMAQKNHGLPFRGPTRLGPAAE